MHYIDFFEVHPSLFIVHGHITIKHQTEDSSNYHSTNVVITPWRHPLTTRCEMQANYSVQIPSHLPPAHHHLDRNPSHLPTGHHLRTGHHQQILGRRLYYVYAAAVNGRVYMVRYEYQVTQKLGRDKLTEKLTFSFGNGSRQASR